MWVGVLVYWCALAGERLARRKTNSLPSYQLRITPRFVRQVNKTLQGLPTQSFPSDDTYVWMDYPRLSFQYPSAAYESDDTIYFASPYTKWPDFSTSEPVNCGHTLDYVSIAGVTDAEEGLCLFVRSPFLTAADSLITVRYSYHDGATAAGADPLEVRGLSVGQFGPQNRLFPRAGLRPQCALSCNRVHVRAGVKR